MIDRLKNCPQCSGILNEAGRCEYCGSKVYDFLTIDFNDRHMPSARTYIRVQVEDKIMLAPIIVDTVGVTLQSDYCELPKIDLELMVVGDMYLIDKKEI